MSKRHRIEPRSGTAFKLDKGQKLVVIDPEGQQVADLLAFNRDDVREVISNGRTFDYADTIYLTTGATLYSNRSNAMLEIVEDDVGTHDFLLTPCSKDTFALLYENEPPHRGCFGNLAAALEPFGIEEDAIPCAFNCFMNVPVDGKTGRFTVDPPKSKSGDRLVLEAKMDLVIGLTACSAPKSNAGSFKPIEFEVIGQSN
ncbi:urea carboxylase-associated family protein [Sphingomicrobium arenosum]|uniref:urea carboxylase-associated family protein n=1 Tax=Sphingomicrobium arenosum TaxID=2233861 RepID=UPI0022406161|nr:urea carboxylase-associated family protein [Sphingomicrobium arenosum]